MAGDAKLIAILFKNVTITASDTVIANVFSDGLVRHFWLDGVRDNAEYHAIARWAGYGSDWHQYAVEHDAAHHFIAEWKGEPYCPVLRDPLDVPIDDAPRWMRDIEHLANRLQRWARLRIPDEYGQLERLFGDQLDRATEQFSVLCWRAWHTI